MEKRKIRVGALLETSFLVSVVQIGANVDAQRGNGVCEVVFGALSDAKCAVLVSEVVVLALLNADAVLLLAVDHAEGRAEEAFGAAIHALPGGAVSEVQFRAGVQASAGQLVCVGLSRAVAHAQRVRGVREQAEGALFHAVVAVQVVAEVAIYY